MELLNNPFVIFLVIGFVAAIAAFVTGVKVLWSDQDDLEPLA